MKTRLAVFLGILATAALSTPASGQLGGRPAEEWAATLESGRRMEGLDIENVVRALSLSPGDVVADIGAGTGIFTVPIATQVGPSGAVLAVEVDDGFLPMIDEKARQANLTNIRPVLGGFDDPNLPRDDVDLAFFHDVLHHIQERPEYLGILADYLAQGSRVAIVDYDANHASSPHQNEPEMLITPDQVDEWMRGAGFERTEEVDLFEEKFFVIYTKTG
ncbi:MAG: methyltransferase domain-containing protein [Gemmatimonas sp.]|nr:methyltransferase domain-containing protein [Gemmatimonas sp.]